MLHDILVQARSKMTCSFPQSRQDTRTKFPVINLTSIISQVEFLRPLTLWSMSLSGLSTTVKDIYTACGFFTTFRFGTWETTVSSSNSTESSLTPFQLTCSTLFDTLYCVNCMTSSSGAVSLYFPRTVNHKSTSHALRRLAHRWPLFESVVPEGGVLNAIMTHSMVNLQGHCPLRQY